MTHILVGTKCSQSLASPEDTTSHKLLLLAVVCALATMISPTMRGQATGSFSGNALELLWLYPLREPAWLEMGRRTVLGTIWFHYSLSEPIP
jgi:hypothetical protein